MREMADRWAVQFDPNSLVTLRHAMVRFDAEPDLSKIRARVLYVLSRSGHRLPALDRPGRHGQARESGRRRHLRRDRHRLGHLAANADAAKWARPSAFLDRLAH